MLKCKAGHEQEDGKFCQQCGEKMRPEGDDTEKLVTVHLHGSGPTHGEVEEIHEDDDLSNPQLERLYEFYKYAEIALVVRVTGDGMDRVEIVGLKGTA